MREVDKELFYTVRQGSLDRVKRCFNQGANIYAKDDNGKKPIHDAAAHGYRNIVEFFLDEGLDVDNPSGEGGSEFTPLHYAAYNGRLEMVKFLVGRGASIYAKSISGNKPMHMAAQEGYEHVIKFFLEQGINIDDRNINNDTMLHLAAENGYSKVVEFLIDKGANVYAEGYGNNKPMHIAAKKGHKNVVKSFLNKGVSINDTQNYGHTLLHAAASKGDLEFVKFLVDKGANIHARECGTHSDKPIHHAASCGYTNIVEFFLDQGLNINDHGNLSYTPLHHAAYWGKLETVRFLVDKGADVNAKDYAGKRPIDVAKKMISLNISSLRHDCSRVVELLSSYNSCVILSTHSNKKQQEAFLRGISNIDVRQVKQGLYLPSFEKRGVKVNGKCTAITRSLSQALLSQSSESFLSNLEASTEIYERIAQGKQVSKREEREVFAFSKLLNNFERQLDSATNSLPSSLIHTKGYKTLSDLSNYIAGIKNDFAVHLVTSNHVVAIYRTGDNYAYFDSNAAFVFGLKSVDQLMQVVEKGVESAGYKVEERGFLVEHFDVKQANKLLSSGDRQVLAKEIKTERQLLAEQDKELDSIKVNDQEISRVQLYDFGTKINVEGSVPLLINADMNLSSKKFQDHLDKKEVGMTAREYLDHLKDSKNVEEVVQATKVIPFIGSKCEIEEAEQIRRPKQFLLELAKGTINYILAAVSLSRLKSQLPGKADDKPRTCLNDPTVNKQLQRSL